MQKRISITVLLATLVALCAPALAGREAQGPQWSENLSKYGYSARLYSYTAIAASNDNVAVALNGAVTDTPAAFLSANRKLSLLIFNANDGKFRTACGPWAGGILFDLWSTFDGNFILYQGPHQGSPEKSNGHILLLSPACQVLKRIELPELGKQGGSEFLISPTRRTFLIEEHSGQDTKCEVQDANTLLVRFKIALDSGNPRIVAVSDDGLLGVKSVHSGSSTRAVARFFYFDFHAQKWSEIPGPDAPDALSFFRFVSNDAFIETTMTGNSDAWTTGGIQIAIRKMDGTTAFSNFISHRDIHINVGAPVAVSPTGNYFGVVLNSYSVASFWRFFDMSPGHGADYVWSVRSTKPVARISVRAGSAHQQLAFAPDDSWFALRNGKTLMVRSLPRQPVPKH